MPSSRMTEPLERWFAVRGWEPFAFQRRTWEAQLAGKSGILQVPTGSGKTYAACLVPLLAVGADSAGPGSQVHSAGSGSPAGSPGPRLVYVTPLRAVARDVHRSLEEAAGGLGVTCRVETRTGDTPQSRRSRQREALPDVLITTPESLSLLISRAETDVQLQAVRYIVLDEWHELLSTKRGVQAELCARHIEAVSPRAVTWALTATLGNPEEAARAAVGTDREPMILRAEMPRPVDIEAVEPSTLDTLPWAGHLGLGMLGPLLDRLDRDTSTLIFTNTRSQAERWYQAIFEQADDFAAHIALHHGSIDSARRREVEDGVREGRVRWVVATSSLDLGIDFHPVETVVQIGSPKGIARLLQRAGRSGHEPGRRSRLLFVPTHGLELIELEAVRRAVSEGRVEPRRPRPAPLDVLAQHLVTLAAGPGFTADAAFFEVRRTAAYAGLARRAFDRVCAFIRYGGESLSEYPDYRRVVVDGGGLHHIADTRTARLHRASIGTITSRGMVRLQFTNRRKLGAVEEAFAARLRKGEVFHFGGYALEFVMMREGIAYVRRASRNGSPATATWVGAGLPYSQTLSAYVRDEIGRLGAGTQAAALAAEQARISALPAADDLLVESLSSREAEHLFFYPFEGTQLHEALGAVLSRRLSQRRPVTLTVTANDYGLELRAARGASLAELVDESLFAPGDLEAELEDAVNMSELAKRRFRGIAQIAGLVFPGYPGNPRRRYELQASATLFFEVFRNHDPGHILLEQARREAIDEELLGDRLREVMARCAAANILMSSPRRPGPFAFPLMVKELSARVSSESLAARVERMRRRWATGSSS